MYSQCKKTNNQTSIRTNQENCNAIEQQMFSKSSSSLYEGSGLPSPCSLRPKSKPTDVSPNRQSGEILVRVQVNGHKKHKKKCKNNISHRATPEDSSTLYNRPPENLTASQRCLLNDLLDQVNKNAINEDLKAYIKTLLSMSRECIDELNVSTTSSAACSESPKSPGKSKFEVDMTYFSALTEKYADKINELVDMYEMMHSPSSPEFSERYMEPPRTSESATEVARPLYNCPPASTPSSLFHSGSHIRSQCRYCQPTGERERQVMRPKTPPPSPRQRRAPVKCGVETGDSNIHCPPDCLPDNTAQYPRPPTGPQSSHSSNQSPAKLPCNPNPGISGSKCAYSSLTSRARSIHTPFSLSSNLLPHPREVFGQQGAASTGPPPGENLDDSMGWMFEVNGMPPPPCSELDPNQLAAEYRREHMPNQDTITTPNSSFDMEAYIEETEAKLKIITDAPRTKSTFKDSIVAKSGENPCTGFDFASENSAVSQPVNNNKIDSIRRKLEKMNEEQYRAILEMLQKGANYDQNIIEFFKNQMESCQEPSGVSADHVAANPNVTAPPTLGSRTDKKIDNLTTITILSKNRSPKC